LGHDLVMPPDLEPRAPEGAQLENGDWRISGMATKKKAAKKKVAKKKAAKK